MEENNLTIIPMVRNDADAFKACVGYQTYNLRYEEGRLKLDDSAGHRSGLFWTSEETFTTEKEAHEIARIKAENIASRIAESLDTVVNHIQAPSALYGLEQDGRLTEYDGTVH